MMLNFSIVKLIDYRARMAELEASKNVFSIVVMAHLETLATREKPQERLDSKLRVVRKLYEKGYQKEDIIELFRFIDWIMRLPEALEEQFLDRLTEIEETTMSYVTSIERIGEKRGIEIGRVEGLEQGLVQGIEKGRVEEGLALIMRQLKRRIGKLSGEQEERLKELSLEQLEELGEALLDFQGEQDLRKWLAAVAPDKEG